MLWYFAYGSNLDPGTFVRRRKMKPHRSRVGRVDGYRLVFDLPIGTGERAVANLAPDSGEYVWGVAYELTSIDADRLDRSEGVHHGVYRRLPVEVVTEDEERIEAFSYASPHRAEGRKPSPRYRGLILTGARHHGLPGTWVRWLEALDLATDERRKP